MNITDEDGETPIYTVESVEVAQWLVDHGARLDIRNSEGLRVSQYISTFPQEPGLILVIFRGARRASR